MLPEFPKSRRKMTDLWSEAFFCGLNGTEAFLSQIAVRAQKEGDAAQIGGVNIKYTKLSVGSSFKPNAGEGMSDEEFFNSAFSLGEQMAGEQAKVVFEKMKVPSPHGMPLEWKPGELRFEQILDIWEKMEIRFGDDGMPQWPMIVLAPAAKAEFYDKLQKLHENPEYREKWARLVERKRKEFNEREARRRLVD